jgi:hypothetical protein
VVELRLVVVGDRRLDPGADAQDVPVGDRRLIQPSDTLLVDHELEVVGEGVEGGDQDRERLRVERESPEIQRRVELVAESDALDDPPVVADVEVTLTLGVDLLGGVDEGDQICPGRIRRIRAAASPCPRASDGSVQEVSRYPARSNVSSRRLIRAKSMRYRPIATRIFLPPSPGQRIPSRLRAGDIP